MMFHDWSSDPDQRESLDCAKQALDNAVTSVARPYDISAMVVLTDGNENTSPMITDVSGSITVNIFTIGFGPVDNVCAPILNALTQNNNGYLLVTGALSIEQTYQLQKYFLQILAGISNPNILLDPHGYLVSGITHRIPFDIYEADRDLMPSCYDLSYEESTDFKA